MSFPVGEVASLGAALCWAIGLTLFRRDVRAIGARQVNLFKGMFATALFLACMATLGFGSASWTAQLALAASGAVGLALGDTLLFLALGRLGAHRTALLASLGPVLTALGGWIFLDEALGSLRLLGILLAVVGISLVVRARDPHGPEPATTWQGIVYAVGAVVCQAAGVLLAKRGLYELDALSATTLRLATATAILAAVALARGELGTDLRRLLRPAPLTRLVPAALAGTFFGLWLMQIGIAHTESAVANALHSTTPLFTLPIALFVLRERLGPLAIGGSFVGVAGVLLLLLS